MKKNKSNKQIAFLGFGSLSLQIINTFNLNNHNYIKFDDNNSTIPFNSYHEHLDNYNWIIALGYKHLNKKNKIINKMLESKCSLYSLIHASSYIAKTANIENGTTIYPMCNIGENTHIKSGAIITSSVTICHDSIIDIGTWVSPGVTILGSTQIGQECFIGAGTTITNNIKIGNNVIIGAGSLISQNIPDNYNVIGNPMKILDKKIKLK